MGRAFCFEDPYSKRPGRAYVTAQVAGASTDTTVYTVSTGKTLYMVSFHCNMFHSAGVAAAQMSLRDSTTVKVPMLLAPAVASSVKPSVVSSVYYGHEPLQFVTSVRMTMDSTSDATCSFSFVGYEEFTT